MTKTGRSPERACFQLKRLFRPSSAASYSGVPKLGKECMPMLDVVFVVVTVVFFVVSIAYVAGCERLKGGN